MKKYNKQIALIHIQKKELGLTDDEYRTILNSTTGKLSSADLNYYELGKVIEALNTLLVSSGKAALGYIDKKPSSSYQSFKRQNFPNAVRAKAKATLGEHTDNRLNGFLQKMNRTSLEECSPKELRRVMGFLSTLQKKQ